MGKSLLSDKEAHHQLVLRMLLYARLSLDSSDDVSMDGLSDRTFENIFHNHGLMRFVMANWIHHFRCSHQAVETEFQAGPHLVCPKCSQHLRHYGSDYDKPGAVFACQGC